MNPFFIILIASCRNLVINLAHLISEHESSSLYVIFLFCGFICLFTSSSNLHIFKREMLFSRLLYDCHTTGMA
jgi:hypothetical protein